MFYSSAVNAKGIFINAKRILPPMLRITVPFTNEIVLNTTNYRENELDTIVVNQFDEVRGTLELSIKTLLSADIGVFMIGLKCPESVLINVEFSDNARVTNFILSGMLNVNGAGIHHQQLSLLKDTYHSFTVIENQYTELVICGEVSLFIVCMLTDTVKKLVPAEEQQAALQKSTFHPISMGMSALINTILQYADAASLHRILLVAKILELLFLDLEESKKEKIKPEKPVVKLADRQKLAIAKSLIGENLQAPCSLIELAHKVGLNDFKLKKGFREIYGTTVFGYLADLRMEKAKEMLQTAQYTVSEVAHEVGYKNAHHFTAAFKKKFGQLPSKASYQAVF
jgi:AraC-like DNA-binding protein